MFPFVPPMPAEVITIATLDAWNWRSSSQSVEGENLERLASNIIERFSSSIESTSDESDLVYTSLPLKITNHVNVTYKYIGKIPPMPYSLED